MFVICHAGVIIFEYLIKWILAKVILVSTQITKELIYDETKVLQVIKETIFNTNM